MAQLAKKKRIIGAFFMEFFILQNNTVIQSWQSHYGSIVETILREIQSLPPTQAVEQRSGEWFFYLKDVRIHRNPTNPANDYICANFNWVKLGLRTEWQKLSTMETRPNLKDQDESELQKAHIYIRLRDGFVLLESTGHIVTPRRIEGYLINKAQCTASQNNIQQVVLHEIVRPDIIREINNMSMIRLARIRLKVESGANYNTNHVFGQLQDWARPGDTNYVDIIAGRENARTDGVDNSWVVRLMRDYVIGKPDIKQAVIEGNRDDGTPDKVRLTGAEQRYYNKFDVDATGQILTE